MKRREIIIQLQSSAARDDRDVKQPTGELKSINWQPVIGGISPSS